MGVIISFGLQKGGVGKTTTTAITAHILSKDYSVLVVDFDSQGNITQFLTGRNIYDYTGHTVLEACKGADIDTCIHKIHDKLHILPAEDLLATFARYLYKEYRGNQSELLKKTLAPIKDNYDFILIDLPPNLGEQTINGLAASDYAVVILQTEPFSYDALERYLETLQHVQRQVNPDLRLLGILTALHDKRTSIDNAILDKVRNEYEDIPFRAVIKRKSKIKEYVITGIQESGKDNQTALQDYNDFVKELVHRVKQQ